MSHQQKIKRKRPLELLCKKGRKRLPLFLPLFLADLEITLFFVATMVVISIIFDLVSSVHELRKTESR